MALPAQLLEQISPELLRTFNAGGALAQQPGPAASGQANLAGSHALPLGLEELDQALPDGGLLRGAVTELAVQGQASLATSISLAACRAAQQQGQERGGDMPWCAFIDPARSLYAPGVLDQGVQLNRLLVVRPPLEALTRVAVRVAESQCFSVVVIDTVGAVGAPLDVPLGSWPRTVRRLSMAVQKTPGVILLLTDAAARRPLTLPVAQRIELDRISAHKLILQVAKDRHGRVSAPHTLAVCPPPESLVKSRARVKAVSNVQRSA
jgi:recombination protein RecA